MGIVSTTYCEFPPFRVLGAGGGAAHSLPPSARTQVGQRGVRFLPGPFGERLRVVPRRQSVSRGSFTGPDFLTPIQMATAAKAKPPLTHHSHSLHDL